MWFLWTLLNIVIIFSFRWILLVCFCCATYWHKILVLFREMNIFDNNQRAIGVDSLINAETVKYFSMEEYEVNVNISSHLQGVLRICFLLNAYYSLNIGLFFFIKQKVIWSSLLTILFYWILMKKNLLSDNWRYISRGSRRSYMTLALRTFIEGSQMDFFRFL